MAKKNRNSITPLWDTNVLKLSTGLRCKVGDLAIIRTSSYPENIGRIVEVVRVSDIFGDGPFYWLIRANGRSLSAASLEAHKYLGQFSEINCADSDLTPITGLPVEEETEVEDGVAA